jgi:hypothetical protein
MTWPALVEYFRTSFPDIATHVLPTTWSLC